jgi:23S rRNA (pseudouridine1915-N3)-methyltransferase
VRLQVVRVGRVNQAKLSILCEEYRKRLCAFIRTDELEIKADARRDKRSANKSLEPLYQPSAGEFVVLLDERGRGHDSLSFSRSLQDWIDDPRIKTLTFLVGPPYGFDDATRKVASDTWSLSNLTIPSDFAWLLVWEQLYRAMTILKGMPYHHD